MRVKFGSIASSGSGSIGGHYMQSGSTGAFLRSKPSKVGHSSTLQGVVRGRTSYLTTQWRNLTQFQRAAWERDCLYLVDSGSSIVDSGSSGINLFTSLNSNRLLINQGLISDPPNDYAYPIRNMTEFSFRVESAQIRWVWDVALGSNVTVIVSITTPLSSGRTSPRMSIPYFGQASTPSATSFLTSIGYIVKYGVPPIGSAAFTEVVFIATSSGVAAPVQFASSISTQ